MLERNSLHNEFYTGRFQNGCVLGKLSIEGIDIELKPSKQNDENQNKMIPASNDSIFESIAINLIAEYYGWNESSLAELHESHDDMLEQMRLGYPQSGSTERYVFAFKCSNCI